MWVSLRCEPARAHRPEQFVAIAGAPIHQSKACARSSPCSCALSCALRVGSRQARPRTNPTHAPRRPGSGARYRTTRPNGAPGRTLFSVDTDGSPFAPGALYVLPAVVASRAHRVPPQHCEEQRPDRVLRGEHCSLVTVGARVPAAALVAQSDKSALLAAVEHDRLGLREPAQIWHQRSRGGGRAVDRVDERYRPARPVSRAIGHPRKAHYRQGKPGRCSTGIHGLGRYPRSSTQVAHRRGDQHQPVALAGRSGSCEDASGSCRRTYLSAFGARPIAVACSIGRDDQLGVGT